VFTVQVVNLMISISSHLYFIILHNLTGF